MKLVIHDSKKAEQFAIIFRHLTQLADYVSIYFTKENISAQGMDDSHVCLFEFQIMKVGLMNTNMSKQMQQILL